MNLLKNSFPASIVYCVALLLPLNVYSVSLPIPDPPPINARGYMLIDIDSGRVLIKENINERMEPASLTKIMTSYVVAEAIKSGKISRDDVITVSEKAWRMPGSRMFIEVGKKVSVEDLLYGLAVQSGNDASVALAEHVAGNENAFVALMNETAKKLALNDTHFMNSTGLPHEDHYTTPHDMAMLGIALIKHHPEHYKLYSVKKFKFNNIEQFNRNALLFRDESVDGIKTGHTESAGYCLVASAKRGDMRLVSVVLGTKSDDARATESQKLLTYGFRFFETHKLYVANEQLTSVKIWKGDREELPLGITQDIFVTIPRGQYDNLDAHMSITATILAPVKKGQSYGSVIVRLGSEIYSNIELVAMDDVGPGSFWHNLVDDVKLWMR